jgi:hypothetical protein
MIPAPSRRRRMLKRFDMPTWLDDALKGVLVGVLIFMGLTVFLVAGSLVLLSWL